MIAGRGAGGTGLSYNICYHKTSVIVKTSAIIENECISRTSQGSKIYCTPALF